MNSELKDTFKQLQQQSFLRKMQVYDNANITYDVIKSESGDILDVITKADKKNMISSEIIDEYDYMLPMPAFCLNEKKYVAKEYGALMLLSNYDYILKDRYLYKNKFSTRELAQNINISRTTLERNIKKLESLDYDLLKIENSQNGIIYKLEYGLINEQTQKRYKYITIHYKMLENLTVNFNSNAIKVYCLLKFVCNELDFTFITEDWICNEIGLNSNSQNNLSMIRGLIKILEECKFIETRKINTFKFDENRKKEIPKITKQYRLCSFLEWQNLDKKMINSIKDIQ